VFALFIGAATGLAPTIAAFPPKKVTLKIFIFVPPNLLYYKDMHIL
jgi:hypothetical protein